MSNYDLKKYSLQQLKKELLKARCNEDEEASLPILQKNIYGLFGSDNSFVFVKQKKLLKFSLFNMFSGIFILGEPILYKDYYLADYFTKTRMSDLYDEYFCDGDIIENNGIDYYVILFTKIIPASRLENLTSSNLRKIQDEINLYLANNPDFISTLFEKPKTKGDSGCDKQFCKEK